MGTRANIKFIGLLVVLVVLFTFSPNVNAEWIDRTFDTLSNSDWSIQKTSSLDADISYDMYSICGYLDYIPYIFYRGQVTSEVYYIYSLDGGETWETPVATGANDGRPTIEHMIMFGVGFNKYNNKVALVWWGNYNASYYTLYAKSGVRNPDTNLIDWNPTYDFGVGQYATHVIIQVIWDNYDRVITSYKNVHSVIRSTDWLCSDWEFHLGLGIGPSGGDTKTVFQLVPLSGGKFLYIWADNGAKGYSNDIWYSQFNGADWLPSNFLTSQQVTLWNWDGTTWMCTSDYDGSAQLIQYTGIAGGNRVKVYNYDEDTNAWDSEIESHVIWDFKDEVSIKRDVGIINTGGNNVTCYYFNETTNVLYRKTLNWGVPGPEKVITGSVIHYDVPYVILWTNLREAGEGSGGELIINACDEDASPIASTYEWWFQAPTPEFSYGYNTTAEYTPCEFYAETLPGTHDYVFSTNVTGAWVNITGSAGSDSRIAFTRTLPVVGTVVSYRFITQLGETYDSGVQNFTVAALPDTTDVDIINMDAGNWVFVSNKRYLFVVSFTHANVNQLYKHLSLGFSFKDGMDSWYRVLYNEYTKSLSVNVPQDSLGVNFKNVTIVGTTAKFFFEVRFMSAIVDALDVDLYTRQIVYDTSDTGWVLKQSNFFNIYSVGGLYDLTHSGWANRTVGGQDFELYAADSRTKRLLPWNDFEVRMAPLGDGFQLFGVWITSPEDESQLLVDVGGWNFYFSNRDVNHTMYPSHRAPDYAGVDDSVFYSYPFGFMLKSEPYSTNGVFAETQFTRLITVSDDEIVKVKTMMMTPKTTGTTGGLFITNSSFVDKLKLHQSLAHVGIAVDFRILGNSSFQVTNGATSEFVAFGSYVGFDWFNLTIVLDITTETYDVYIDEILECEDFGFRDSDINRLGYVSIYDAIGTGAPGQYAHFYIDDMQAWTDFSGDYGGTVVAGLTYHNLQHFGTFFGYGIEGTGGLDYNILDQGYVEFGWDMNINTTWVQPELKVRIQPIQSLQDDLNNWIKFNITWYSKGNLIKSDVLYSLYQMDAKIAMDTIQKEMTTFYIDIWVAKTDYGAYVCGRINAEYFGVSAKAPWLFYWSLGMIGEKSWGPKGTDVTQSMFSYKIYSATNVEILARQADLTRCWAKVYRTNYGTSHHRIRDIDQFTMMSSPDVMMGIDTPEFTPVVVPTMDTGHIGFKIGRWFASIGITFWGVIRWLSIQIGTALINSFRDIYSWLQPWISQQWMNLFGWLLTLPYIGTVLGWLTNFWTWGTTLIGSVFSVIGLGWNMFIAIITGFVLFWSEIWVVLDIILYTYGDFMPLIVMVFIIELFREGLEEGNWTPMIDTLRLLWGITSFFLNWMMRLVEFLADRLIGGIPV